MYVNEKLFLMMCENSFRLTGFSLPEDCAEDEIRPISQQRTTLITISSLLLDSFEDLMFAH